MSIKYSSIKLHFEGSIIRRSPDGPSSFATTQNGENMRIIRAASIALLISSTLSIWAQCTRQKNAVADLQSQVQADEDRIRRVNPALQAGELESWAKASEKEKEKIVTDSLNEAKDNFAGYVLGHVTDVAKTSALSPMEIAGVNLPYGIGSLGTGQANTIIRNLNELGISIDTPLISAIRRASETPNKKAAIEILARGVNTVGDYGIYKHRQIVNPPDSPVASNVALVEVGFQIAGDLAGYEGPAIAIASASFDRGQSLFDAWMISRAVNSLGISAEQQLKAINALTVPLKNHVIQLQQVKAALADCQQQSAQPNLGESGGDYDSQRQALMDHAQADNDAIGRCINAQVACYRSCPNSETSCLYGGLSAEDQCMGPLKKDWDDTMQKVYALDAKHFKTNQ